MMGCVDAGRLVGGGCDCTVIGVGRDGGMTAGLVGVLLPLYKLLLLVSNAFRGVIAGVILGVF